MTVLWLEVSHAIGISVGHTLWQGLIVGGMLYLILKAIPDARPAFRYLCAYSSIVVILVLFIGNLIYYFPENLTNDQFSARNEVVLSDDYGKSAANNRELNLWEDSKSAVLNFINNHSRWISFVWLSGVFFSYVRLAFGLSYLARLHKSRLSDPPYAWKKRMIALVKVAGVTIQPALKISDKIKSPVTYGWIKPIILIPAGIASGLSADQVELIILHELAHIKRNDFLFNLLKSFAQSFLFFHPVVWWASAIIEEEREKACDDFALSFKNEPIAYIKTLALAAYPDGIKPYAAMAVSDKPNLLSTRINRIVQRTTHKHMKSQPQPPTQLFAGLISFIFLILILTLSLGLQGQSVKTDAEASEFFKEETPNQLIIEVYNDNNESSFGWTEDNSMLFTGPAKMPSIIFNGRLLTPFKSGEIPEELKNLQYSATEGLLHELSGEEKNAHDRKWKNGLVKITLREMNKKELDENYGEAVQKLRRILPDSVDYKGEVVIRKKGDTLTAIPRPGPEPVNQIYYNKQPKPLFLVNGKIVEELTVAPNDIQSIEVIKDAESLKSYGAKGEGGLIKVTTKIVTESEDQAFKSSALYPNPSDETSTIEVAAREEANLSIQIFDLHGVLHKTIANEGVYSKGKHTFTWDTASLEKGIYIVQIKNGKETSRHKLIIE